MPQWVKVWNLYETKFNYSKEHCSKSVIGILIFDMIYKTYIFSLTDSDIYAVENFDFNLCNASKIVKTSELSYKKVGTI